MSNIIKTILIIIGIVVLFLCYKACTSNSKIVFDPKEYIEKIDSLNHTIDILQTKKDSVQERIDTVVIKIKENSDKHEKIANYIVNNTPSDDYLFFSEYIRDNSARLDSIYNL